MMQNFSTSQKIDSINKIIERLKPFFNNQFLFEKILKCENNSCVIRITDLIGQHDKNIIIYNSADTIENYLFNFESYIISTLSKSCPFLCSCEM